VVLYDLVARAASAQWTSSTGSYPYTPLPFPGSGGDAKGFAHYRYSADLEDGSRPVRVLETFPPAKSNGRIEGSYDLMASSLKSGDRLVVRLGFLKGATSGLATFKVLWWDGDPDSSWQAWITITDNYDGKLEERTATVPADAVGKRVYLMLRVDAGASATQDAAVWAVARVERP